MTAPQCERPATTAGAPPVPMTLRAIAAWLESHPAASMQSIDTDIGPDLVVRGYLAGDDPDLLTRAREIGPDWMPNWRHDHLGLEWRIAPGVVYRLRDAR